MNTKKPVCSIILPFYNSSRFIESALNSIAIQTFKDFELIVIDDGSTDNSGAIILEKTSGWEQDVIFLEQANQGSYVARNFGLDHCTGAYITFFDSDDLWIPEHLEKCLYYLQNYHEVDAIYCNCRIVDLSRNGAVLHDSAFHMNNRPNTFLELNTKVFEELNILNDSRAVKFQILYGLYLGLQFTVFRREVFKDYRFNPISKNVADQVLGIEILLNDGVIGYLKEIHGVYHLHESNSSAANRNVSRQARIALVEETRELYLLLRPRFNFSEKVALAKRISREYFWSLGYNVGKKDRDFKFMFNNYLKGIAIWPFDYRYYKSLLISIIIFLKDYLTRGFRNGFSQRR